MIKSITSGQIFLQQSEVKKELWGGIGARIANPRELGPAGKVYAIPCRENDYFSFSAMAATSNSVVTASRNSGLSSLISTAMLMPDSGI